MRIAIVGAGIAGLGSAWLLKRQGHDVTLFEAESRAGGHTHTVDVTLEGITHPVDTGFLVFNDRTYPKLVALFDELGVGSVASDMSFAVRHDAERLEWAGTSLLTLFARPGNALRPRFWSMLRDILRFNRETTAGLAGGTLPDVSLGGFLELGGYGAPVRDWYLLPMAAAIWSAPRHEILAFPLRTFVRFCHNHGLLSIDDRPQWRTVQGGGRTYVDRILAGLPDVRLACPVLRVARRADGVTIDSRARFGERFDGVVMACHSDQALELLPDAWADERRLLRAVRYQPNRVVLHTDASLLPRRPSAWSAWNYLAVDGDDGARPVAVSYLINKLQPLPFRTPVIVTLNPPFEPDPALVLREFEYDHPLLDGHAIAAQHEFAALQGRRRTWFAGAWLGYGFHEDGLASAHAVAEHIGAAQGAGDARQRIAA
ncbi:MAG: FAD-dependent oxidoreductase [Betaproteobacteria bacterium]|nr:FAD-dependent oxidoreductase [Betaproteobacteria bacterium]MDH5287552.1 FAD-dependent oxidoreductase [Betaproteobacteria bacterium]